MDEKKEKSKRSRMTDFRTSKQGVRPDIFPRNVSRKRCVLKHALKFRGHGQSQKVEIRENGADEGPDGRTYFSSRGSSVDADRGGKVRKEG